MGMIPVVMAGVLGIYGLIISVILTGNIDDGSSYNEFKAYAHLASGLSVGLSALGAGMAIGIVGDAGVRANGQQPRLFVGMILILIFAEADCTGSSWRSCSRSSKELFFGVCSTKHSSSIPCTHEKETFPLRFIVSTAPA